MRVLAVLLIWCSFAAAKSNVKVEVLDSQSSTRSAPFWQTPGVSNTTGTVRQYGNSVQYEENSQYTAPQTHTMVVTNIWIKSKIDNRNAVLWCNNAWRSCSRLNSGESYDAELDGDSVTVVKWNFDHSKSKKIKYKITGNW